MAKTAYNGISKVAVPTPEDGFSLIATLSIPHQQLQEAQSSFARLNVLYPSAKLYLQADPVSKQFSLFAEDAKVFEAVISSIPQGWLISANLTEEESYDDLHDIAAGILNKEAATVDVGLIDESVKNLKNYTPKELEVVVQKAVPGAKNASLKFWSGSDDSATPTEITVLKDGELVKTWDHDYTLNQIADAVDATRVELCIDDKCFQLSENVEEAKTSTKAERDARHAERKKAAEGVFVTTVDKLFTWYAGEGWAEDCQTANTLMIDGKHSQDESDDDGLATLEYLSKNGSKKISVKNEVGRNQTDISFELNGKKYEIQSVDAFTGKLDEAEEVSATPSA